jgi:hypothetical protein
MPAPLRVVHDIDPKQAIVNDVGALLQNVKVPPYAVLLVMYERAAGEGDKKTKGGIILPQAQPTGTMQEDTHQGKVGLIIKMGDLAFASDDSHKWDGFAPQAGDWVAIRVGDTYSFDVPGPRRCRIVEDANIQMIVPDESFDAIW